MFFRFFGKRLTTHLNMFHEHVCTQRRCNCDGCGFFHTALLLRTCHLAVTNDCHLHSQSCKRPFLWLLQAAFGLEGQHLQGVIQGVPGFLCHVHRHQHHLQVGQREQPRETSCCRHIHRLVVLTNDCVSLSPV